MYRELLTKEELDALLDEPEHIQADDGQAPTLDRLFSLVQELQHAVEVLSKRVEQLEAGQQANGPSASQSSRQPTGQQTAKLARSADSAVSTALPSRKEKFGTRKSWFSL